MNYNEVITANWYIKIAELLVCKRVSNEFKVWHSSRDPWGWHFLCCFLLTLNKELLLVFISSKCDFAYNFVSLNFIVFMFVSFFLILLFSVTRELNILFVKNKSKTKTANWTVRNFYILKVFLYSYILNVLFNNFL